MKLNPITLKPLSPKANIKSADYVFNSASHYADQYRQMERDLWKKMMNHLPQASKYGEDSKLWLQDALKAKDNFIHELTRTVRSMPQNFNKSIKEQVENIVKSTTNAVDGHLNRIREAVPSFNPPSNPMDKLTFIKYMNEQTLPLLKKMQSNTMTPLSKVIPQYSRNFGNVIDNTIIRVNNGKSLGSAVRDSVKELARQNINNVVYPSGKIVSASHYVEMVTRTELLNTHVETQKGRMADYGLDLVRISEHADCSSLCQPYQGKVFSISGKDKRYPPLDSAISGGLYHINCRHMQFPYIEELYEDIDCDQVKILQGRE